MIIKRKEILKNKEYVQEFDQIDSFSQRFESITSLYEYQQDIIENDPNIKSEIIKLVEKQALIYQITFDLSYIGICALFQIGCYLKSVQNRSIKIGKIEFNKKNLVFAAEQSGFNYTFRQAARYMKYDIAKLAYRYQISGHLFQMFKNVHLQFINTLDSEELRQFATYATDFQIENQNAPIYLREYLANREKTRNVKSENKTKKQY